MRPTLSVLGLLLSCSLLAAHATAFSFDLHAKKQRCFTEELPTGVEMALNFAAAPGYAQFVDVKVTDPMNKVMWQSDSGSDRGKFTTTITHGGDYAICFYSRMVPGTTHTEGMKRTIAFDLKTGTDTHDYAKVASEEHLKPMEVNLRVMEDIVRSVHGEYVYYKERETEMRDTNEHMNTRVTWATIITMMIIVFFALWQVRHLKHYFRRKRMID